MNMNNQLPIYEKTNKVSYAQLVYQYAERLEKFAKEKKAFDALKKARRV